MTPKEIEEIRIVVYDAIRRGTTDDLSIWETTDEIMVYILQKTKTEIL